MKEENSKRQEAIDKVANLLADAIAEREEIVARMASLNETLDAVQSEREAVKEKVMGTAKFFGNQAKTTFGTLKAAMSQALEYVDNEATVQGETKKAEGEEENKQKPFDIFTDAVAVFVDDLIENHANGTLGSEKISVDDIYTVFGKLFKDEVEDSHRNSKKK